MPPHDLVDWPAIETLLSRLPVRVIVAWAVRSARRAAPAILVRSDTHGPVAESREWLHAVAASLGMIEAYARGEAVSPFTRLLAAEFPRIAGNALAQWNREHGPSGETERIESALAVVAFTADATRAATPERAVAFAVRAAQMAAEVEPGIAALAQFEAKILDGQSWEDDACCDPGESGILGELWPLGEPVGWTACWQLLAADPPLSRWGFRPVEHPESDLRGGI